MLKIVDKMDALIINLWRHKIIENKKVDRESCPFDLDYLGDKTKMKQNLLNTLNIDINILHFVFIV